MTQISLPLLDQVRVASPCPVPWEAMMGDERTRTCSMCALSVNNISDMTRDEAEAFLQDTANRLKSGQRVCVHFYRRPDGTILTQDCPVGIALWKRRARTAAARAVAALGALCASIAAFGSPNWLRGDGPRVRQVEPFATLSAWLAPRSTPPPANFQGYNGDVCITPPPPAVAPTPATKP